MKFNSDASVGLLPSAKNSISLKLTRDEAIDLWNSWCKKGLDFRDELASWDDLREYVFSLTGQQPGLMAHVLDFLIAQGLKNILAGSMEQKQKARDLLLSRKFYDSLSQIRSLITIEKVLRGEIPGRDSMRSVLRKLLSAEGVGLKDLTDPERVAADSAVEWGQFLEDDGWLSLPSELHRRFLFREVYCTNESTSDSILKNGLHAFIDRVIERFNPRQLKSSKARNASGKVVYGSQYQNEFYRAACSILPADSIMSPNVGPLFGAKGYLDYYLLPHRWGFELLVDGSELKEHQTRFGPGGAYHKLIRDGVVSEHAILDLRTKPLVEADPDVLHIVFSEDFEKATLHRSGSAPQSLDVRGIPLEN